MIRVNSNMVIALHSLVGEVSGGGEGIRDIALLDSAIESAYQTFGGVELYPTIIEKASRIAYSIVANHAFVDGNKRVGVLTLLTILRASGIKLDLTNQNVIDLGLSLAEGRMGYSDLVGWIEKRMS